jgi:hypothetical protein
MEERTSKGNSNRQRQNRDSKNNGKSNRRSYVWWLNRLFLSRPDLLMGV